MSILICEYDDLESIADEIRVQSGTTNKMEPAEMVNAIKANNDEIDAQEELINQISVALDGKASNGSTTLPTLTNPGTSSDLLSGKQLIDESGNIVNGSIVIRNYSDLSMSMNDNLLNVPAGYYEYDQAYAPAGKNLEDLITMTVNKSTGKVTATADRMGYVSYDSTATLQLVTMEGTSVTPGKDSKNIVTPGTYVTGTISVSGDSNLIASNIKSGVSIFGVTGNYEGGEGPGGTAIETYTGTISSDGPTPPGALKVVYTDKNLDMQIAYPDFPFTFEIVKNSIVFTSGGSCTCISGCEAIDEGMGMKAYKITENNFVINYMA